MERKQYLRLSAIVFIVGAVLGLLISLGGLVVLWANKAGVTEQITGTVALVGDGIAATDALITTSGTTLDEATKDLDMAYTMIVDVSKSLDDSSTMVSSTADLIGTSMVDLMTNTKTSLASMENSAKAVDSILIKINQIPLLGPWLGNGYDPTVTLQTSVAGVSRSLDPLPDAFSKIGRDLDVSSANIATIKTEIEALAKQIGSIQDSVASARRVVKRYDEILAGMQTRYDSFEKRIPVWINAFYFVMTAFLLWLLISQVGMLLHGIYLLTQEDPHLAPVPPFLKGKAGAE